MRLVNPISSTFFVSFEMSSRPKGAVCKKRSKTAGAYLKSEIWRRGKIRKSPLKFTSRTTQNRPKHGDMQSGFAKNPAGIANPFSLMNACGKRVNRFSIGQMPATNRTGIASRKLFSSKSMSMRIFGNSCGFFKPLPIYIWCLNSCDLPIRFRAGLSKKIPLDKDFWKGLPESRKGRGVLACKKLNAPSKLPCLNSSSWNLSAMKSRDGLICKPFIPTGGQMRGCNAKTNFPTGRSGLWACCGLSSTATPCSYWKSQNCH